MAQMTQIIFRAFLKLVIGRNYLYLPSEYKEGLNMSNGMQTKIEDLDAQVQKLYLGGGEAALQK